MMKREVHLLILLTCSIACAGQDKTNFDPTTCNDVTLLVRDKTQMETYCNEQLTSGPITEEIFVKRLLCNERCIRTSSILEDYFGISSLDSGPINYSILPAVLPIYEKLGVDKKSLYSSALDFYLSCFNGDDRIVKSCYISNILFMIIRDIRISHGDVTNEQVSQLITIYEFFIRFDNIQADIVLDALRLCSNSLAKDYIRQKKFKSDLFKSPEMVDLHKKINDNSYVDFL